MVFEVPTSPRRLCCGLSHWGAVCPDGKVMCCMCFERFEQSELDVDVDGTKWDVCKDCRAHEVEMQARRTPPTK